MNVISSPTPCPFPGLLWLMCICPCSSETGMRFGIGSRSIVSELHGYGLLKRRRPKKHTIYPNTLLTSHVSTYWWHRWCPSKDHWLVEQHGHLKHDPSSSRDVRPRYLTVRWRISFAQASDSNWWHSVTSTMLEDHVEEAQIQQKLGDWRISTTVITVGDLWKKYSWLCLWRWVMICCEYRWYTFHKSRSTCINGRNVPVTFISTLQNRTSRWTTTVDLTCSSTYKANPIEDHKPHYTYLKPMLTPHTVKNDRVNYNAQGQQTNQPINPTDQPL